MNSNNNSNLHQSGSSGHIIMSAASQSSSAGPLPGPSSSSAAASNVQAERISSNSNGYNSNSNGNSNTQYLYYNYPNSTVTLNGNGTGIGGGSINPNFYNNYSSTIIISNPLLMDSNIYKSWLKGYTVDQTTSMQSIRERYAKFMDSASSRLNAKAFIHRIPPLLLVRNHIANQYRFFESLEHYLHRPKSFVEQFMVPMPPEIKRYMVERYYCFDENVIRELLGKRLNARSRKDLDEVSEKTKVSLASCRRQFDNLKRIYKRVEDIDGDLIETIMKKFLLPKEMACSYAHILFITENRLDTSRKKLALLLFSDFEYCASVFMNYWTLSLHHEDIDDVLAQDLRDLRSVMINDKSLLDEYIRILLSNSENVQGGNHHRNSVYASNPDSFSLPNSSAIISNFPYSLGQKINNLLMKSSNSETPVNNNTNIIPIGNLSNEGINTLDPVPASNEFTPENTANQIGNITNLALEDSAPSQIGSPQSISVEGFSVLFKMFLRTILQIGATLSQSKEFREIFSLLMDKMVEPLTSANPSSGVSIDSFEVFMEHLNHGFVQLSSLKPAFRDRYKESWRRLVEALKLVVIRLYQAVNNRRYSSLTNLSKY